MAYSQQQILSRRQWSDNVFSFTTTRPANFDFKDGEFVTLGLRVNKKLIPRAYSIVSTHTDAHLEFLSIEVANGPLTSHLAKAREGGDIWINSKSTGSLTVNHVLPGRHLFLIATGTGVAPFISLVRGGEIFRQFEKTVLVHTVRKQDSLAFRHELESMQNDRFAYCPTVTREDFAVTERGADLFRSGKLCELLGLPAVDPALDRVMLCGNPEMNRDIQGFLDNNGWQMTNYKGVGNFSVEQAFVLARD